MLILYLVQIFRSYSRVFAPLNQLSYIVHIHRSHFLQIADRIQMTWTNSIKLTQKTTNVFIVAITFCSKHKIVKLLRFLQTEIVVILFISGRHIRLHWLICNETSLRFLLAVFPFYVLILPVNCAHRWLPENNLNKC